MKVHYNSQHNPSSQSYQNNSSTTKSTSSASSAKAQPQKYFDGAKKGEVNELKQLLKNTVNEKDEKKKREIVKKVIAYMTLGIDVSRLFSEMCMHSYTNDIIIKKMIYLYLTNYAEQNPDDIVMAINTFLKDCGHKDPKIRGMALRSLCSLRFSGSFDYLMPAIQEALKDFDAYVRKTAVLGCLKVYYVSPDTIKNDADIIETLYKMIRDTDTLVISNAISALQEILDKEFLVSTKMIIYLLNRLKEFPEFNQVQILQLAATYVPKSEQECFDIMNLLDERLRHSCVSIVLATVKVFLNYSKDKPAVHDSVNKRIKAPLLTLMTSCEMSGQFEIAYTVLEHIKFVISKGGASNFYNDYKHFYIKADETSYIKLVKLEILSLLASENNIGDMLNELGEYVTDIDENLARNSIKTLGAIASRIADMAIPIVKQLSTFISMKRDYICNQTMLAFQEILRKYPEHYKELGEVLPQAIEFISEEDSKCALFWIIGQFGKDLENAPYILENYVTGESDLSLKVKNELLSSCTMLFLIRPPEMQTTLGQLFKQILGNEQEDIDLRDRAAFYYRAMQNNIEEFKEIMLSANEKVIDFTEDDEAQKRQETFQFNSLSIIYNKPPEKFVKPYSYFAMQRRKEAQEDLEEEQLKEKQNENEAQNYVAGSEETQQQQQQQQPVEAEVVNDLLGDFVPSNEGQSNTDWTAQQSQQATGITLDDLQENFNFESEEFESQWENLENGANFTRMLNQEAEVTEEQLDQLFNYYRIYSIATGEEDDCIKFYMYANYMAKNTVLLVEADFNLKAKTVTIITKSADNDMAVFFSKYLEELMRYSNLLMG